MPDLAVDLDVLLQAVDAVAKLVGPGEVHPALPHRARQRAPGGVRQRVHQRRAGCRARQAAARVFTGHRFFARGGRPGSRRRQRGELQQRLGSMGTDERGQSRPGSRLAALARQLEETTRRWKGAKSRLAS